MRIDSCRSCGADMQEFQSCPECRETYQFICPHCRKISNAQVHIQCKTFPATTVA